MGSMYMGHLLLSEDGSANQLLSASLMKYWRVPDTVTKPEACRQPKSNQDDSCRSIQLGSHGQSDDSPQLTSGVMASGGGPEDGSRDEGAQSRTGFSEMDTATLARLGWSDKSLTWHSGKYPRYGAAVPKNAASVTRRPSSGESRPKYRLSKVEFKRLTEQVRDVGNIIKNKFRKPPAEKLYRLTAVSSPDPATQALRDELQASRHPFHPRVWRPLTADDVPEPSVVRCWPVNSRPTTAHGQRSTLTPPSCSAGARRPRSTPVNGLRTPHNPNQQSRGGAGFSPHPPPTRRPDTPRVDPGNFDTLSPRILSLLVGDVHPRPSSASYGDRILTKPPKKRDRRTELREKTDPAQSGLFSDDVSTTSGIDSDVGDDVSDDDDDDNNNDDLDGEEDDDSSDSENGGFEPSLEEIRRQMPHPQSVFRLRPEKLDAIYVPEDKRDMRRFDFDAEKADQPPYDFKCPLPVSLAKVNLRLCAREGSDWRDFLSSSSSGASPLPPEATGPVKGMMDRLVELERCQIVTEEWENKKLRGQMRRQVLNGGLGGGNSNNSGLRSTSVLTRGSGGGGGGGGLGGTPRDKRCCGLCLQAACVGDCPEKRLIAGRCDKCHQPLCTGACQDSRYEQRMRHARSSDSLILDEKPPPPPPRSPSRGCHSCLCRHNAKLLNANSLLLGRPKSSLATYARGKSSARPSRDLRPASAMGMHSLLLKDFERMGIEPQQPAPPATKPPRPRSRNGLLPGKSSRSNRKNSITDLSYKKKKGRQTRRSKAPRSAS